MRMELRTLHRACVVYAKLHNPSYRIQVREGVGYRLVPLRGFRKFCNYIFRKVDHTGQLQKVMKIVITKSGAVVSLL